MVDRGHYSLGWSDRALRVSERPGLACLLVSAAVVFGTLDVALAQADAGVSRSGQPCSSAEAAQADGELPAGDERAKPAVDGPEPAVAKPQPAVDGPGPAVVGPQPPANRPEPAVDGPASALGGLKPAADRPGVDLSTLPPEAPDPTLSPVVGGTDHHAPPEARSIPTRERPMAVVKVILGLLALMALAYLGGHRKVIDLEKRLGISQVITAGLPFIVLGLVARLPAVGILTDPVLAELGPLLRIGLGSIGFVAGFRFDAKLFQGLPRGTSSVALLSTLVPSATVAAATAPLLLVFSGTTWSGSLENPVFIRDALILATAGAMTARSTVRWIDAAGDEGIPARIIRIEELAGVLGLAFVAAFFRRHGFDGGWHLPGMMWLLLTLGLGTALGLLFYAILVATPRGPDFLSVTIGAIAFTAGAAGYLYLSSVAVAFVAGVILANFPGDYQPRLRAMLKRVERPIYLVALFVVGALWNVTDWRGWALMPVFMAARLLGKGIAAMVAARRKHLPVTAEESRSLAISPIGALAIAIVVNAQLLYPSESISLVVSAVIGGGVLTEAFVQLAARRSLRGRRADEATPRPAMTAVEGSLSGRMSR